MNCNECTARGRPPRVVDAERSMDPDGGGRSINCWAESIAKQGDGWLDGPGGIAFARTGFRTNSSEAASTREAWDDEATTGTTKTRKTRRTTTPTDDRDETRQKVRKTLFARIDRIE